MKAKEMIRPGTSFFLDSGSTTTTLAAVLNDQPNMIVTSSVSCALELAKLEKPQVLIPGGILNRYSLSICGSQGIRELQNINLDMAFIGVTTYDEGTGFACNVYEESQAGGDQKSRKKHLVDGFHKSREAFHVFFWFVEGCGYCNIRWPFTGIFSVSLSGE